LVFSIIAKNATQSSQSIVRGGIVTGIGTAVGSEATMFQGGLNNYDVPSFKTARIRGSLTVISLGSNSFLQIELFDTRAGRIISQARATVNNQTVFFDFSMAQRRVAASQDFDIQSKGDNVANDGSLEWSAEITELPNNSG